MGSATGTPKVRHEGSRARVQAGSIAGTALSCLMEEVSYTLLKQQNLACGSCAINATGALKDS